MTTDELTRELLAEIRAYRSEGLVLSEQVKRCIVATAELSRELREFRELVFEGERNLLERVRQVSDFAGMTDPHDGNGNGGG